MKKLMLFVLLFPTVLMAQSVSGFAGISSANNLIYGAEFKSKTAGFFVERYISNRTYASLSEPSHTAILGAKHDIVYDGLMFGTNLHVKAMSNILISVGIGLLTEQTVYYVINPYGNTYSASGNVVSFADTDMIKASGNQVFAFEVSCGKDFEINDNMIIGIKGGVNSRTDIFGTMSIGFQF
jgi:hypothetical protein